MTDGSLQREPQGIVCVYVCACQKFHQKFSQKFMADRILLTELQGCVCACGMQHASVCCVFDCMCRELCPFTDAVDGRDFLMVGP